MTRDQQLRTLKRPKASKEQLREALAASLGVEYERQSKEKEKTVFSQCGDTFLEAYKKHTGLDYSFGAKDGKALSGIINKIYKMDDNTCKDICLIFAALINNLPDWYKANAFSLTVINNKFNEIVASIRKNGGKTGITNSYKADILSRMRTRNAGAQSEAGKDG